MSDHAPSDGSRIESGLVGQNLLNRMISRRRFIKGSFALAVATVLAVRCSGDVIDFLTLETTPETAPGWTKDPANPLIGPGFGTIFDICILHEEGLYRAWVSWRDKKSIAYCESTDGRHFGPPEIVFGPSASGWEDDINRAVVLHHDGIYEMWYTGQTSTHSAIGRATSPDGLVWTRDKSPVLVPQATWEKVAVMSPHVRRDPLSGLYRLWYSAGDQYEPDAIGYAESFDGINWTKRPGNPILVPGATGDWDGDKVTGCHVEQTDQGFVMFYIGFHDVNSAAIGMARSDDGITGWKRLSANPILRPGHWGAWDADADYKPSVIHENGGWLLYYNGRHGHLEQIGRATYVGDRFDWS